MNGNPPFKTPPRILARKRKQQREKRSRLYFCGLTQYGTRRKLNRWSWGTWFRGIGYVARGFTASEKKIVRQKVTRRDNLETGKRYDGKPRKNKVWKELGSLTGHDRQMARQKIWQQKQRAELRETQLDRQWRSVRAGISVGLVSFEDAYRTTTKESYI